MGATGTHHGEGTAQEVTVDAVQVTSDSIETKVDLLATSAEVAGHATEVEVAADLVTANAVPSKNSVDNVDTADVTGNKTDDHDGNSIMSFVHRIDEHLHKASEVYPDHTAAAIAEVVSHADAITQGVATEIIPLNAIDDSYDVHFLSFSMDTIGEYVIALFDGATEVGHTIARRTTNKLAVGSLQILTSRVAANTALDIKISHDAGGGAKILGVRCTFHRY